MEVTRSIMIISTESVKTHFSDAPEDFAKKIRETMEELGMKNAFVSVVDCPKLDSYDYGNLKGE